MASNEQISDAVIILSGAGWSYVTDSFLTSTTRSWCTLLKDVDGEALLGAAEYMANHLDKWPTIKQVRKEVDIQRDNPHRNHQKEQSVPRAAPIETRKEADRLHYLIGDLLDKQRSDWTFDDRQRYEAAVGAKLGSAEEQRYWSDLLGRAYYIRQDVEPPAHPEFKSWNEAQAWNEAQPGSMQYVLRDR